MTVTARPSPWLVACALMVLTALMAAAFVQARQITLLQMTVQSQDDYLVISLNQLETEYLRLREALREATRRPAGSALQLRYDIFQSRLSLLNAPRAQRLLHPLPDNASVLDDLARFTRRADLYLGSAPKGPLSPQAASALLDELQALDEPLHRLLLDAGHLVAGQITERQRQVRQHNRIGMALTATLIAMVLGSGVLVWRQMRLLDQRRGRLQHLADELREARITAEAASEAKSDFLADMSHELRTPLHGLLGMLAMLREAPRDARADAWLATADESARHLRRLLDDMLDLSKLEDGTLALAPQPVVLATLAAEVIATLQPAAAAKGLQLHTHLAPGLPARAQLDPTRVKQVLFNLMGNAVKFSDAGAIVLTLRPTLDASGRPMLEAEVADTGIGMNADTVARLFKRFSRADDPRARLAGGTGLGLAISRNLAELMQGHIEVRSTPGAGSVFTFRCPLVEAGAEPPAPPAPPADAAPALPRPSIGALSVLVAEDHPVNQMLMGALLERLGHQAHIVDNGLLAVEAAGRRHHDLVLMDVHMPLMDGVDATRAIRALPAPGGQPVIIALTADVFADTRTRMLDAGADELLTKPVGLDTLRGAIARHFGAGAGGPPAGPTGQAGPAQALDGPLAERLDTPLADTASASGTQTAATLARDTGPAPTDAADAGAPHRRLIDADTQRTLHQLLGTSQLPSLLGDFFRRADQAVHDMRSAMRLADTGRLCEQAHALKGAAASLGLPALAAAAGRLCEHGRTLPAAELALAVQRIEELSGATRAMCHHAGLLT